MGATAKSICNLRQYAGRSGPQRPYAGSYPSSVLQIIPNLVSGRILHLYSGSSTIGTVRVDLECEEATHKMAVEEFITQEATHKMAVEEFITQDMEHWDWAILDPPYKIQQTQKLREYGNHRPLSGNALFRDRLRYYFRSHVDNILWLDHCAPTVRGFSRRKLWLLLPGKCFETVRVLSWLARTGPELDLNTPAPA